MQLSRWFIVTVLSIFRTTSWEWQQRSVFFWKNGPSSASFFVLYCLFKTKITILTTNICEKMLWPSSIRCQDSNPRPSEHESPPITTWPGLPPIVVSFTCMAPDRLYHDDLLPHLPSLSLGTLAREWKKASSARPERILPPSRKTMKKLASTPWKERVVKTRENIKEIARAFVWAYSMAKAFVLP